MGHVTKTISKNIGEVFQSENIYFESYEDFMKYENTQGGIPSQISDRPNVYLTEAEIYKLLIILGHVALDKECDNITKKLEASLDYEIYIDCEDYDKMYFTTILNGDKIYLKDGLKDTTILFKEEDTNEF